MDKLVFFKPQMLDKPIPVQTSIYITHSDGTAGNQQVNLGGESSVLHP